MIELPHEGVVKFLEYLKKLGAHQVLDLGCGDGRHMIFLAKQGFIPTGIDIAMWGLRRTKEWAKKEGFNPKLACADVRLLPLEDESFDSVISIQVIHHQRLSAIRETIIGVERVLRTNGLFYFSVPRYPPGNWKDKKYTEVEERTYVPLDGLEKDVPHHFFTKEELESMLKDFEILEIGDDSTKHLTALVRKAK